MPLSEQLRAASQRMRDDFGRRTTALEQRLDRGEAREGVVRGFLRDWLPKKYAVGNGEVIGPDGQRSRQMDIVVYDELNSPLIFRQADSPQVYPIESVYGVIQVKSRLTPSELTDSLHNVRSCIEIPRQPTSIDFGGAIIEGNYRPFSAVFGFSGPVDPDPLLTAWATDVLTHDLTHAPSIACVLEAGCFMYGSPEGGWSVVPGDSAHPIWVDAAEDSLMMFFLAITSWMSNAAFLTTPDLIAYAGGSLTFPVRIFTPGPST
jgi:hypothetical protein